MDNEGLRWGMFLAGALMAGVPVTIAVGLGIYALRNYLADPTSTSATPHPQPSNPDAHE